jgi:pimeloyl-ACP methyl ester carboxylesterase
MKTFECCHGAVRGVHWGQGPRLLALHGFLDNAMSFKALAECLPEFEIWAIDLPGHGLSEALPKQDGLFILNWLIPLGRVLDDLNWPSYTLLGHSMGAILSQLLAGVDKRIERLISLDALGPLAATQSENLERFQRLYNNRQQPFKQRQYSTYDRLIQSRRKGIFPLNEQAASTMAERAVKFNGQTWSHRYDRQLRNESLWRMEEQDVQAWLKCITLPIDLALFGSQHWSGYRHVFEQRLACLQNVNVTQFDGSHHMHMEAPEPIADWIRAKLS